MSAGVAVRVATPAWRETMLPTPNSFCCEVVSAALATVSVPMSNCDISLLLTDDVEMMQLNSAWRGVEKPTNVLAFAPHDQDGTRAEGDIAVSYATVAREARAHGIPIAARAAHMIVHGVLHLLGYRHAEDAEAQEMVMAEVTALARLGLGDPYEADQ